jgi:ABC-type branched-subunit amino acid transport system ATPase component
VAPDGVDLHVGASEVVALVGKNGAGLVVAAAGAAPLAAGNLSEVYGVLLQGRPNSYAAYGSGQEPWIGSDVAGSPSCWAR